MELIKAILIVMLSSVFTIYASNTAQENNCSNSLQENTSAKALNGGKYKPSSTGTNEYMKVLVVFVQFQDTDVDINNTSWPKDQMPTWANDLISSDVLSNYPEFTLSDYWKEMSMDNFDFIGDIHPNLVTINTENYYKNAGHHFGECNKDALTQINASVDFSDYDNWSFNSTSKEFEFLPDGYVDMIVMIYRTPNNVGEWFSYPHSNFTAVALLSDYDFSLNFDNVEIFADDWISTLSSGITVQRGLTGHISLLPKLAHEYGHSLFGAGHNSTEGMMTDPPKYALNAWERERLDYITYTNCTYNDFPKTLEDYIEDGDVLRIPIPVTNQNSSTYFLVENCPGSL